MNYRTLQCVSKVSSPVCVFWDYEADNGTGNWSTEGCYLVTSSKDTNNPSCECNHLTSFAVLMVLPQNDLFVTLQPLLSSH